MNRARIVSTAALVALAMSVAGCSDTGGGVSGPGAAPAAVPAPVDEATLRTVTLRVGDQKAGSQALLQAAGQLTGVPYKIEWSQFSSGPPLLEAANAGAIDIGGVGNTPPIFAAAANSKIAVVSADRHAGQGDAILVPAGSMLRTVADLKGKRVALAKGSSAHGHLLEALAAEHLSIKDVQATFLAPADAYAAFAQGRVDGWAIWDPYTAQAQLGAGARVLADGENLVNGLGFQVAGRAALADPGRNSAIGDYVRRLAAARRWAVGHQPDWAAVWAQQTGLPTAVTAEAVARQRDLPVALSPDVIASEQQLADLLAGDGSIPSRVDVAAFVDHRFDPPAGS